jgi:hypothetical protein
MPFKDKLKRNKYMQTYREDQSKEISDLKMRIFNIEKGNVCSMCEKQLHWLYREDWQIDSAGAICRDVGNRRAICRECFDKLKVLWLKEVKT